MSANQPAATSGNNPAPAATQAAPQGAQSATSSFYVVPEQSQAEGTPDAGMQGQQLPGTLPNMQPQGVQLPDNFKSVEDVLKSYTELQGKFTQTSQQIPTLEANNKALQSQLEQTMQLVQQLSTGITSQPQNQGSQDYLNMSGDALIEAVNNGQLPAIINAYAGKQAEGLVGPIKQQLEQMQNGVKAVTDQFVQISAVAQYQRLKDTYKNDPNFDDNMKEAGQWLASPSGMSFTQGNPQTAVETAYKTVLANRITDPAFMQQMAEAAMKSAQQTAQQKLQQTMQPQPGQTTNGMTNAGQGNQQQSDWQELQKVLNFAYA